MKKEKKNLKFPMQDMNDDNDNDDDAVFFRISFANPPTYSTFSFFLYNRAK